MQKSFEIFFVLKFLLWVKSDMKETYNFRTNSIKQICQYEGYHDAFFLLKRGLGNLCALIL